VRLPRKDKLKVVRAAKSFGESMTAFVMHAVWREIERRERAQEMIQLSRRISTDICSGASLSAGSKTQPC